jgi:RES domain-containing protein
VIVYRLAKAAYAGLDGEGARLYGGRWNAPGRPMVYTAATPSLAVLEILVHLDLPLDLLPDDYRLLTIDIPDDAPVERLERADRSASDCLAIGEAFLDRGSALVLLAPSAVVPQEQNALINVMHPDMVRLNMASNEAFGLDPRLLGIGRL